MTQGETIRGEMISLESHCEVRRKAATVAIYD